MKNIDAGRLVGVLEYLFAKTGLSELFVLAQLWDTI